MTSIILGRSSAGIESLDLRLANRHGLVTGATGTGKTVTLQVLAERHGISPGYACSVRSGKRRAFAIAAGVKATVVKTPPARHAVDAAPSIFGPIGHYLPADTAVSRAHGGAP